jgi:predicted glycosyltransferase
MNTRQLEQTFNESERILCRSGYTTIMDLVKLGKKAFFIPTPGQYEQEYLAVKLDQERIVPFANQGDFRIEMLSKIADYKGLSEMNTTIDWEELFEVFQPIKNE